MKNLPLLFVALLVGACSSREPSADKAAGSPSSGESSAAVQSPEPQPRKGASLPAAEVIESSTPPDQGFSLRLNVEPGSVVLYDMSSDVTFQMDKRKLPADTPAQQNMTLSTSFTVTAKGTKDGVTDLHLNSTKTTVMQNGQESAFNATDILVGVDNRGRVVTAFTDPIAAMLGLGFVPFPKGKVTPGTEWRVEGTRETPGFSGMSTGLPREMDMTETYRLQSGSASSKWVISSDAKAKGLPISTVGTYEYDPQTGLLLSAKIRQSAELDLPLADGGKVPTKATVVVTVKRRDS